MRSGPPAGSQPFAPTAEGAGAEAAAEAARTATLATGVTAEETASEAAGATPAGRPSGIKAADGPGDEVETGIAAVAAITSTGTGTAGETAAGRVRPGVPDGRLMGASGPRMRSEPVRALGIPLCRTPRATHRRHRPRSGRRKPSPALRSS